MRRARCRMPGSSVTICRVSVLRSERQGLFMHELSRQCRLRVGFSLIPVACSLALLLQPVRGWSAEPEVDPLSLGVQAPESDDERLGLRLEAWAQRMDLRRED